MLRIPYSAVYPVPDVHTVYTVLFIDAICIRYKIATTCTGTCTVDDPYNLNIINE